MLINCVVYEGGSRLKDIGLTESANWLGRPERFVWVALRDPTDAELSQMQSQFRLHDLAIEDARKGHQRPKVEEYEDYLFAVLHLLDYRDGEVRVGEIAVFVGCDFVLSVRRHSEQGFLGVRARAEREPHLLAYGPGYVFYALADAIVDRYFPVVDALESELEEIERTMFGRSDARQNIEKLYALKHKAAVVRHAVLPLLDAFGKLFGGRVPSVIGKTEEYFRDVHDHLLRINAALDTLRETISTAIQVNLSMVTIEQSDIAKRLAAWAAIFAVLTALAGIWGMNFEHMPELHWRYGYVAALAIMVLAAVILFRRFRRLGWL
ncbi:MAG TPA: magnesium/cobalt transporter CorA [Burkholderiales bacterium]|nr:magnesium/cobalt transporter CorA [Burkholderiales bacterium]